MFYLPKDRKFDPDLKQVGTSYLHGEEEYSKFKTDDRSKFTTYGYDAEERDKATLLLDKTHNCFVDSVHHAPITTNSTVYNVTREGKLIIKNADIQSAFNHSSITRDGAVICAGYIALTNGKITAINNHSGHYMPTKLNLYNAIQTLGKNGNVFDPECVVSGFDMPPNMKVNEFLAHMNELVSTPSGNISRYQNIYKRNSYE